MAKHVAIISGGMDSATLLYDLCSQGHEVIAVSFNYGQRHSKELQCAAKLCELKGVEHVVVDLADALRPVFAGSGSSQVDDVEVPHGHYADENMKITVVPNRNMLMLAVATSLAISRKAPFLAYGAHAGDHTIYPDCRAEFVGKLADAIAICDWHHVELHGPYTKISKTDVCRRGHELGVPFEHTWSCYEGQDIHCGQCGTCVERKEAFRDSGVPDPTRYRA